MIEEITKDPELKSLMKRQLELENRRLEIGIDLDERNAARIKADGEGDGEFTFVGIINELTVHMFIEKLENYARRTPGGPITIKLNSQGGSVLDGLALVDYLCLLRKRGHHVTVIGFGLVASMASGVMMAADERVMTPRCFLGLHEVQGGSQGSLSSQEDYTKFSKALQDRIVELLCERSSLTPTKLKRRWARKDIYFTAEQALKEGLIDRIEEV